MRVVVFVEYENEVTQEEIRLKALLDKLRIDATIRVFWLASGQLQSYETIVNGRGTGTELGNIVNELLKDDEWWQELQKLRTESHDLSRSQELASLENVLNATRRRGSSVSKSDAHGSLPRGLDVSELLDKSKKPTVSTFAKLGVNFGIHTHQLISSTFGGRTENNSPDISDDDGESTASEDVDFNDVESAASDGGEGLNSARPGFLAIQGRRRSHGDLKFRVGSLRKSINTRNKRSTNSTGASSFGYGTIAHTTGSDSTQTAPIKTSRSSTGLLSVASEPSETSPIIPKSPSRPTLSRHTSATRFTSKPTPETTVLPEGDTGSRITFSKEEEPSRVKRPALSRNASAGRFSSRPVPDTRVANEDEDGTTPRLTFAEPEPSSSGTPLRSRRNSASKKEGSSEVQFNLPELLASYNPGQRVDEEAHSVYSTQSLPLSFNDLPSRAQHLILNELMRQNSSDTAVLLTTLPIPEEGTCQSEEASLGYLTDIEVLCHELPPVLLVLSNNMTVTVNL